MPFEYEELIAAAYRRQGYRVVENGGGGADGGIDLILLCDGDKVLHTLSAVRTVIR